MSASPQLAPLTAAQLREKAYAKERAQAVAEEIRQQLGNGCLAMLGAHTLAFHGSVGSDPALSLKIRGSNKVNYLKISLTPQDLYRMEFGRIEQSDAGYVVVHVAELVYTEDMHSLIETHTGLRTSL